MQKRKRALVTGGSRGIGRATCIMLAKNGYDILLNFRKDSVGADTTKKAIEKYNVNCKILQFDVADFDNAKNIIEEEIQSNGAIDVLVHNAAVRNDALFPIMKKEDWDITVDVNLKSFYYIVQPIVMSMFKQRYGKVVIISSTSGLAGVPGQVNYASTKAGLIGAVRSLAVEVASRNINVNAIAPGIIDTEMTKDLKDKHNEIKKTIPARRIGQPEDIANAVEFLISEKSSYMVGHVLSVNGGVVT